MQIQPLPPRHSLDRYLTYRCGTPLCSVKNHNFVFWWEKNPNKFGVAPIIHNFWAKANKNTTNKAIQSVRRIKFIWEENERRYAEWNIKYRNRVEQWVEAMQNNKVTFSVFRESTNFLKWDASCCTEAKVCDVLVNSWIVSDCRITWEKWMKWH